MRKSDIAILVVLMLLSAANSFGAILSTSKPEEKAFILTCLENQAGDCQAPANSFFQKMMEEVSSDLEREALLAGKSREQYLSTDAPFVKTLEALQSDEFKNQDRADMTISIVKLGMRYHYLKNTRFVASNFFENETTFRRLIREISSEHNLPFQF